METFQKVVILMW